jgi:hypothetical protein
MASIDIYDPKSGQVHEIPYEHVQDALTAGGEFADEYQMKKAQEIQSGTYEEGESFLPEIKTNPFLPPEEQPKQEKQQSDRTGFRGIGLDVIDKLSNALKNGRTFLHELPQEAEGASYQFGENPNRAWGQIGASAAETGKGLINAPKAAGGYLAEKGLGNELFNQIQQQLAELVPGIPEDTGVEKALGLEEKEVGDKLLRALPGALIGGAGAKSLVKGGAGLVKSAVEGPKNKLLAKKLQQELEAAKEAKIENALDEALADAEKDKNISAKELEDTKNAIRLEFMGKHNTKLGERTPVGQQEKAMEATSDIEKLKAKAEIPEEEVGEIPPKETGAEQEARINAEAKAGTEAAKTKLSEGLGYGKTHEVEAGKPMVAGIEKLKSSASDIYNKSRADVRGVEVPVDKSAEINKIKDEISKLQAEDKDLPGYAFETPELQELNTKLAEVSKVENVPATHLLDVYTSLNKWITEARRQIYKRGSKLDDVQKTKLKDIIEGYQNKAEKLGDILETASDNPEFQTDIKKARGIWKTYSELWDNPVGKHLLLHGTIPPGTMGKLARTTKGNEFLNGLVEADPEIAKHILGQMYSKPSAVKGLLDKLDITEPYKRQVEGVFENTEGLRSAIEREKEAKVEGKQVRTEHEKLVEAMTTKAKEQLERKQAIKDIDALNGQIDSRLKASDKIQQKIDVAEAKTEKYNQIKGEHTVEQKRLEKENRKNIERLKAEINEHESKISANRNKVKKLGGLVLKGLGVQSALGFFVH